MVVSILCGGSGLGFFHFLASFCPSSLPRFPQNRQIRYFSFSETCSAQCGIVRRAGQRAKDTNHHQ